MQLIIHRNVSRSVFDRVKLCNLQITPGSVYHYTAREANI